MRQLDQVMELALKLPQLNRLVPCWSFSMAFLSVDGIRCDVMMFRSCNKPSHCHHVWSLKGNLRKYCQFFCASCIYSWAASAFVVDSSRTGLDSWRVKCKDNSTFSFPCTAWLNHFISHTFLKYEKKLEYWIRTMHRYGVSVAMSAWWQSYKFDNQRIHSQGRGESLHHCVKINSRVHLGPCQMGRIGKIAGVWSCPLSSI
jgi:hypothetical protein